MNGEVAFQGGVRAGIARLDQRLVYGNVLEGVPNRGINRDLVSDAVQAAGKLRPQARCYLVEPSERAPHVPHSNAVFLPSVVCSAVLRRDGNTPNDEPCWETLVVVWFQDEYALPIASQVLQQLQTLEWNELAVQELI